MSGRWQGWLAYMGWPQRVWWIALRWLIPWPMGRWERPTAIPRRWAADGYVRAYMAWKANGYEPERWP